MAIRNFSLMLGFTLCAQLVLAQVNTATVSGTVHDESGAVIASNDDWGSDQKEEIEAILPPADARESAILATLAPGNYTCVVLGKESAMGVALVEVYRIQ